MNTTKIQFNDLVPLNTCPSMVTEVTRLIRIVDRTLKISVRDGISSSPQPNMGRGRKSLKGRLLASGTPRVGLSHRRTLDSACVLCLSFKSGCAEFRWSFGTYQRGVKDRCTGKVTPSQSEGTP